MLDFYSKTKLNMFVGVANSVISALQTLWYVPYVKKYLGNEAYGYIGVINGFIALFMVITLAVTSMSTRFITVEMQRKDDKRACEYFNSVFWATLLLFILIVLLGLIGVFNINNLMNVTSEATCQVQLLLIVTVLGFVVQLLSTSFLSSLYYYNDIFIIYSLMILDYILRVFFTYVLFSNGYLLLSSAALGVLFANLVGIFVYFFYVRKKTPFIFISVSLIRFSYILEIIKSGIWVSITKAGSIFLSTFNTYYSNILCGVFIAGIYASISQISCMAIVIVMVLINCLQPKIYKLYVNGNKESIYGYLIASMYFVGAFVGLMTGGISSLGGDFLVLWLGIDFYEYKTLLLLSVIYFPFSLQSEVINQFCILEKKVKIPAIVNILFGFVNIAIILVFVKIFELGVYGIAYSNILVSFVLGCVFFPIYFCKVFHFEIIHIYKTFIQSLFITLFTYIMGRFFSNVIQINGWISFFTCVFLLTGFVAISVYCVSKRVRQQFRCVLQR